MASSEQRLRYATKASADKVLKKQRLAPTTEGEGTTGQTGASAMRPLPQLPIEAWENVINHLWDDQRALRQCSLICRAWYPPSHFHLRRWIKIKSVKGVKAYAKVLKQTPELSKWAHDMTILVRQWPRRSDLSVLSTAAILLAPKLPRLETLTIRFSRWQPWTMHKDIFLHLSAFSITRLHLETVAFPSITVFGRLVCALPGLVELRCKSLEFTHDHFHRNTFGLYHNRLKIKSLLLEAITSEHDKLFDFLAHPCISSHLQRLIIHHDGIISMVDSRFKRQCQQLLDAASGSLSELRLELQLQLHLPGQWTGTKVSAADLLPSFTHSTSLQRLWLNLIKISDYSGLDKLYQVLPSIKSGQLREIVIMFNWASSTVQITEMNVEVKNAFEIIHEPARYDEIDNYLSSDSFRMLSKLEFALIVEYFGSQPKDRIAALNTVAEEQWKQIFASLFPRLTKRGIFHATVKEEGYEKNF